MAFIAIISLHVIILVMKYETKDFSPARPENSIFSSIYPHPDFPITYTTFHELSDLLNRIEASSGARHDKDKYPTSKGSDKDPDISIVASMDPGAGFELVNLSVIFSDKNGSTAFNFRNDCGLSDSTGDFAGNMVATDRDTGLITARNYGLSEFETQLVLCEVRERFDNPGRTFEAVEREYTL